MQQSPSWEAYNSSDSWVLPLLSPEVHYDIQKNLPLVALHNQMNPVPDLAFYFFQIHFNIIHPPLLVSYKWYPPLTFLTTTLYTFLMSFPYDPPDLVTLRIFGGKQKARCSHYATFPYSHNITHLRSTHLPHYPVHKHPQLIFCPLCEAVNFTCTKCKRCLYSYIANTSAKTFCLKQQKAFFVFYILPSYSFAFFFW